MAASLSAYWVKFFKGAGFSQDVATKHAVVFSNNRIQPDMLPDLDKPSLKEMGITLMGDMIAILRYAKKVVEDTTCEKFLVDSEDSVDIPRSKVANKTIVKKVPNKAIVTTKSKVDNTGHVKVVKTSANGSTKPSTIKKVISTTTEVKKPNILKRKLESSQIEYNDKEEGEWTTTPQKKSKTVVQENESDVDYKVVLPKESMPKSRQILKKAAEQKRTVFDRLGDSSVTSTTNLAEVSPTFNVTGLGKDVFKRSSSVFNRLGDKDAKKDSTSLVGILKNGTSNNVSQGILKNRLSSVGVSTSVNKNVSNIVTKKSEGTMHADHEANKKNSIASVRQLVKTTKKIIYDAKTPNNTKTIQMGPVSSKLASERLSSIPAKARLGVARTTSNKQVTFNTVTTVTHLKRPDVFSRLGI